MNQQQEKSNKFLTILGTVLCIILVPILVINCTLIAKSYLNKDEVPSVGGYMPLIVLTDSMYPTVESGDLIICHTEDAEAIKVDDIFSSLFLLSCASIVSVSISKAASTSRQEPQTE